MQNVERRLSKSGLGGVNLEVNAKLFRDDGGNDCVRVEAYYSDTDGNGLIGGADIRPYPASPMFSVVQHAVAFKNKGLVLAVSAALVGAVGPIVGECLGDKSERSRQSVAGSIAFRMDDIVVAALTDAWKQVEKFNDLE